MKNLLAIAIVMLFTAFAAQAVTDNCNASATGTFTFQVEEAIGLTANQTGDIDLGAICPGCSKDFTDQCYVWTLKGGKTCLFEAFMTNPTAIKGITVDDEWQVNTDNAWDPIPSTNLYNIFANDKFAEFRVCVNSIFADCNVDAGDYSLTYQLAVNYTCAISQ